MAICGAGVDWMEKSRMGEQEGIYTLSFLLPALFFLFVCLLF